MRRHCRITKYNTRLSISFLFRRRPSLITNHEICLLADTPLLILRMIENTFLASVPLACRANMRCICPSLRVLYISQIITLDVPSGRPLSRMRVGMGAGAIETGDMKASEEGAESCDRSGGNCQTSFDQGPYQGFRGRVYKGISA